MNAQPFSDALAIDGTYARRRSAILLEQVPALGNAFLYHKTENTIVTWSAQPTRRWQVQASSAAQLCRDRARRIKSVGYGTPNQKQIPHNLERVAIACIHYPIALARAVNQPLYPKRNAVFGTQNNDKLQHNAQPS